jgi:hypothetical protein
MKTKCKNNLNLVKSKPFKLTEKESRLVGELWDESISKKDYILTDRPIL